VPTWLGIVLGLITLIAALGLLAAFFRVNLASSTIALLKENNEALSARVGILEQADQRKTVEIDTLKAENTMLRNVVTGVDALKRLDSNITDQNALRRTEHEQILSAVTSVHDLMFELLKRVPGAA